MLVASEEEQEWVIAFISYFSAAWIHLVDQPQRGKTPQYQTIQTFGSNPAEYFFYV